jgi:hypothetical protein
MIGKQDAKARGLEREASGHRGEAGEKADSLNVVVLRLWILYDVQLLKHTSQKGRRTILFSSFWWCW